MGITVAFETEPLCIVVVTPIMKRARALAAELLFVDTTSSCDSEHHSVTFLHTPCAAGATPLGVLITQGQSTEVYTKAFRLFQSYQELDPKIIITDNSAAETAAIREVWPNAIHLLCVFHILQAIWRWLWDSKNAIAANDRPVLMNGFKAILYNEDLLRIEESFIKCVEENGEKYPQWKTYVTSYWQFKEKWCLAYRDQNIRGHHTNNFSEASIRIFKDVVLSRLKVYNVISLIDFCATKLEEYHMKKLRDFANFRNRKSYLFFQNTLKKSSFISKDDIVQVNDNLFIVPSAKDKSNSYTVESDIGSCTCPDGKYGRFCKHQSAVYQFFQVRANNFPAVTAEGRYEMAKLALGPERVPPPSFYEEFLPEKTNEQTLSNSDQLLDDVQNNVVACASTSSNSASTDGVPHCDEGEDASLQIQQYDQLEDDDSETSQRDALIASVTEKITEKVCAVTFDEEVSAALKKFASRINHVQSKGQLLHFLHTSGSKRLVFNANCESYSS